MPESMRRIQNLYWTIRGDYNYQYNEQTDFFETATQGIIDKELSRHALETFLFHNTSGLTNEKDLVMIAYIMAQEMTREQLLLERPGLKSFEQDYFEMMEEYYHFKGAKNLGEELYYNYCRYHLDKPIYLGGFAYDMFMEMMKSRSLNSTRDLINALVEIYKKYFHITPELRATDRILPDSEEQEVNLEEDEKEESDVHQKPKFQGYADKDPDMEQYNIESAEFTGVKLDPEKVQQEDEEEGVPGQNVDKKRFELRVNKHFGRNELSLSEQKKLEKDLSTGIHQGIKFHLSKGNFDSDINSQYFESVILAQERSTMDKFKKNEHVYNRIINQLREIIKKNLLDDQSASLSRSHSGAIDSTLVWRHEILGEENIFKREFFDEEASVAVDILLDMSASQQDRQEEVSIQGYLIAEALTELSIPTRVMGFCNLFNYQVLRVFRDYNDDLSYNRQIFKYKSSGSNRDGLALRYVFKTMERLDVEDHILIVLSDGKPNDKIHTGITESDSEIQNYEGEEAVYDAAMEVLQGKMKGTAILGVFTGDDEDLDQERLIFGSDFVRITDISRFSFIVGRYLKTIVDRL